MALIEKKEAGEETVSREPAEKGGKVIDLMEALRKSLAAAKGEVRRKPARRAKPARKRKKAS